MRCSFQVGRAGRRGVQRAKLSMVRLGGLGLGTRAGKGAFEARCHGGELVDEFCGTPSLMVQAAACGNQTPVTRGTQPHRAAQRRRSRQSLPLKASCEPSAVRVCHSGLPLGLR